MATYGAAGALFDVEAGPAINRGHRRTDISAASGASTVGSQRTVYDCAVCHATTSEVICSAREVRSHLTYLERFHRRRLRRSARNHDDLIDRADFTQDYATDIARCTACGFVYRREQPVPDKAAATYARDHYGSERLAALFDAQLELFRPRAARLAEMLKPGAQTPLVIEIGSFVGGFLMAAQERSWQAIGIDPGREVAEFCRSKGLSVLQTPATDAQIAPASADVVCIWNTFDQLPDTRATLATITQWLRPRGLVAIRVPSGACFATCMRWLESLPRAIAHPVRVAMAWNNLLSFPYLHGYSIATLDRLLSAFGLQRIAFHPSVLPRLADARTRPWAVFEEQVVKSVWRTLTRYDGCAAPWFDAYYRYEPPLSSG
jgi:hypothetical protein